MATAADESDTVVMSPATAHGAWPVDSCSLVNPAPAGSQRRSATVELDKYDGSTALENHLAKLKNCANYYCWSNYEQKCHLIASELTQLDS